VRQKRHADNTQGARQDICQSQMRTFANYLTKHGHIINMVESYFSAL
jgi:hypothetical protein